MKSLRLGPVPHEVLHIAPVGVERRSGDVTGRVGGKETIVPSGLRHGTLILDTLGVATALLAAWWWYLAGTRRVRRLSRFEAIDAADFNRIVTAINRSNVLSCRAALAAAASAVCVALRFAIDMIAVW